MVQCVPMDRIETENGRSYEVGPDDTGEMRAIALHDTPGGDCQVKIVTADVERVQVLRDVEVTVDDDASAEDVDAALILAADDDWFEAETVETYPNGPRAIVHIGEA